MCKGAVIPDCFYRLPLSSLFLSKDVAQAGGLRGDSLQGGQGHAWELSVYHPLCSCGALSELGQSGRLQIAVKSGSLKSIRIQYIMSDMFFLKLNWVQSHVNADTSAGLHTVILTEYQPICKLHSTIILAQ